MILMDLSQLMFANVMQDIKINGNSQPDINILRHMILNSIRKNRKQFKETYGELVICCDDANNWRREIFPYYKASRRKGREEDELDWNEIFKVLNAIRDELKEFFPYKVLQVDRAEADDIIGTLAHKNGVQLVSSDAEMTLILSGDRDYIQLHKYANVHQYDPTRNKKVTYADPIGYLQEHIIKGDTGDGIPNVFMKDNFLVIREKGDRQKTITKGRLAQLISGEMTSPEIEKNLARNKKMIDLSQIPEDLQTAIIDKYNHTEEGDRSKLFDFFMKKRLRTLMDQLNEF